jgi:hypothetical protein
MTKLTTITQDELIKRIKAQLKSEPKSTIYSDFSLEPVPVQPAAFTLILGAGFSYGVVPLVNELMQETIGDYYYPVQDQSSERRPAEVLRKNSTSFWLEFNDAAAKKNLPTVALDAEGLPENPGAAYQRLFTYEGANILFTPQEPDEEQLSFIERFGQHRKSLRAPEELQEKPTNRGERFVKGFLRYVLDPGTEHGYGSTGRNRLNDAHIYLAALLEMQQLGLGWETRAFCRTIFTTNFDTLLQNALQMVNLLYRLMDRPEKGLDKSELLVEEGPIHLVYTHGSILRYNPASTVEELSKLEKQNIEVLHDYLESRDVIIIGYGGWNDGLMTALHCCDPGKHKVYWCDIRSQPASHVARFLEERADSAKYVQLGETGADGFMRSLYEALIPADVRRDPMQRREDWVNLVWRREAGSNREQSLDV